uniref:KIAA1755 ortholog n=1 Tax=Monodelphis domestica TaxID=13616 RepID=F6TFN3_MONDO
MDSQSLDTAIQSALAALYPPFEATAPTILGQVFRLLEIHYQGDGLCCLLDFLIPAKRLFEQVREAACAPYSHCVFLHTGWPLCLGEKVVVHLAPLNPLLLRQGDFYLQAEPHEEQSVCIMVKCLSKDLRNVEERPVPESSYPTLFTKEWLEGLNQDLDRRALHSCLVATEKGVSPEPWLKITAPKFVNKPQTVTDLSPSQVSLQLDALDLSTPRGMLQMVSSSNPKPPSTASSQPLLNKDTGSWGSDKNKYPGLIKVEQTGSWKKSCRLTAPSMDEMIIQNLEGDYVDLLKISKEKRGCSSHRSTVNLNEFISSDANKPLKNQMVPPIQKIPSPSLVNGVSSFPSGSEKWTCGKPESSEDGPCTPCLRRKLNGSTQYQNSRCRYRESYLAALQNPVSFSSGLMTAIKEESDNSKNEPTLEPAAGNHLDISELRSRPNQASSPQLHAACPHKVVPQESRTEEMGLHGYLKFLKSSAGSSRILSRSGSPTAHQKFSFLKGQRQSPSSQDSDPPEKVTHLHNGPWKIMSSLYSPKMHRAKSSGKAGPSQTKISAQEASSTQSFGAQSSSSMDVPERDSALLETLSEQPLHAWDLKAEILLSGIACLPGSQDKTGRPLLQVTTSGSAWDAPWCSAREVTKLLIYLCSIPRQEAKAIGLTVVIDARKQAPTPCLVNALRTTQALAPASLHSLLFLGEKEAATHLEKVPAIQVEVLTSLKALGRHVDQSQLTPDLEGSFPYCHSQWVQFFQRVDPFLAELRKVSTLLQDAIQEFEKGKTPKGVQEAAQSMTKYKQMMESVLSDAQLVSLQRDGGATLARLRKETCKLAYSQEARNSMALAMALYSQVEERVHVLVTTSNKSLERLESLVQTRELECEFHQISEWIDREGSTRLKALTPLEWSLERVEKSHEQFEEFFQQATAHYNRGLELSKQAAKFQGAETPEMAAFVATKSTFQAKLTHFYMAIERHRTDLETLLHLYRFCNKMTWFNLDCQDLVADLKLGEGCRASPDAQRHLESYLQRLAVEFPAEKLWEMWLQASSLSRGPGLGLWEEARLRRHESHVILQEALTRCQGKPEVEMGPKKGKEISRTLAPGALEGDSLAILEPGKLFTGIQRWKGQAIPGGKLNNYPGMNSDSVGPGGLEKNDSSDQSKKKGGKRDNQQEMGTSNSAPEITDPEQGSKVDLSVKINKVAPENLQPPPWLPGLPTSSKSPTLWKGLTRKRPGRGSRLQFSRHGSFSSEETDSQTSLDDSPLTSPVVSLELSSPQLLWAPGKGASMAQLEGKPLGGQTPGNPT